MNSLLAFDDVTVRFRTRGGDLRALAGVSFALSPGESLGVVGESGCGKTTIARTILRLLPSNGAVEQGRVLFRGLDLLAIPLDSMRRMRWREIALVTQSAMNALDPIYRVGEQIVEAIRAHESCSKANAWVRAEELFEDVGLPAEWTRRYPHEFSGGMRQRAIIAMAIALNPALIVADEPTTALDVIMQERVFEKIASIRERFGTALILITHDISLVAENCDRAAVMYAGQIVEIGKVDQLFGEPLHPYTIGLQNAFADLGSEERAVISIPGAPPDLLSPIPGCRFAPRCPLARTECNVAPRLEEKKPGHWAACHFTHEADTFRNVARDEAVWDTARVSADSPR